MNQDFTLFLNKLEKLILIEEKIERIKKMSYYLKYEQSSQMLGGMKALGINKKSFKKVKSF